MKTKERYFVSMKLGEWISSDHTFLLKDSRYLVELPFPLEKGSYKLERFDNQKVENTQGSLVGKVNFLEFPKVKFVSPSGPYSEVSGTLDFENRKFRKPLIYFVLEDFEVINREEELRIKGYNLPVKEKLEPEIPIHLLDPHNTPPEKGNRKPMEY